MDRKSPPDENPFHTNDSETRSVDDLVPPVASAAATAAPMDDLTIAEAMQAIETLTVLYGFSEEAASEAVHHVTTTQTTKQSGGPNDLVALCCEFILDHGLGIDTGGAIAPIDNCPHVAIDENSDETDAASIPRDESKACVCILVTAKDVPENIFDAPCRYHDENKGHTRKPKGGFKDETEFSEEGRPTCPKGENWWCLQCGGIYCSRYVNGHGVKHYEEQIINNKNSKKDQHQQHCVMIGLADLSVWCHVCGSYLETRHNKRLSSILQRLQDIKFRDE